MVVVSLLPHAEFGQKSHLDDTSYFTIIGRSQGEKLNLKFSDRTSLWNFLDSTSD